jgi:hypothetical protein
VAPVLTSFTGTPSVVDAGANTSITWSWTYASPPQPAAGCSIDQGVGPLSPGGTSTVNLSTDTSFTLSCSNDAGTNSRTTQVQVANAPIISSFTMSPASIPVGVATVVTYSWTYSNAPVPTPVCQVEHGVGTLSGSGATSMLNLTHGRTYQLRCTNSAGSGIATATIGVNDCARTTRCDAHASCVETSESYTCTCNTGFTGDGFTCSALAACVATPSLCSPNAVCTTTSAGAACVCAPGWVGDGTTCARERLAFVTTRRGVGNLSAWPASGIGLAAGDGLCQAAAADGGLPGTYVAWLSDQDNDAYCRVHGLTGKKSANCGQLALPAAAGPWAVPGGLPFAEPIDRFLTNFESHYPPSVTERGQQMLEPVFTGTNNAGVLSNNGTGDTCTRWQTSSSTESARIGNPHASGDLWTNDGALACSAQAHLLCFETGTGPALPAIPPVGKRVFVAGVGNGNLTFWTGAAGATGLAAADNICRYHARLAGLPNAGAFKAWLSTAATSATSRVTSNGPWVRSDGVIVAASRTELLGGVLRAPVHVNALGAWSGSTFAWTATFPNGSSGSSDCNGWTSASSSVMGQAGHTSNATASWVNRQNFACNSVFGLYCFED